MAMRISEPRARPLPEALALGPALLARAAAEGEPELAASLIEERSAVVLGALQRRDRVHTYAGFHVADLAGA